MKIKLNLDQNTQIFPSGLCLYQVQPTNKIWGMKCTGENTCILGGKTNHYSQEEVVFCKQVAFCHYRKFSYVICLDRLSNILISFTYSSTKYDPI